MKLMALRLATVRAGALQGALPRCGGQWQRSFFNLPKFPSSDFLLQGGPETQSYRERKIFPYRSKQLYEVISDVESYSHFVPYCTESKILESKVRRDGVTVMEAELTVGFLAFEESYVSAVTCKPNEFVEAVASSSSPLFKTLTTMWQLQPVSSPPQASTPTSSRPASLLCANDSPTVVTLDITFAFANPIHATVSAAFFGQVSKLMVKAFEQRCIALYGRQASG